MQPRPCLYVLPMYVLTVSGRVEWVQRLAGTESLKYLLFVPSQEMFAEPLLSEIGSLCTPSPSRPLLILLIHEWTGVEL